MGKAPAAIIVARHGARLDAADKQWHLTSPTPYDPPLTYGGWTQSRTLGIRIGNIIRAREDGNESWTPPSGLGRSPSLASTCEESADGTQQPKPRSPKKYRVIVHASPFLRCVQTAIAVSAGINQVRGGRAAQSATNGAGAGAGAGAAANENQKCLLRLDAFLGEWLTPDYFEQITPPPGSVMMLASAKGELLRRGETVKMDPANRSRASLGHFPGGWNGAGNGTLSTDEKKEEEDDGPLKNMSAMTRALSCSGDHAGRHVASAGTSTTSRHPRQVLSKLSTAVSPEQGTYVPPTPTYAISPSDPIPAGYVAHARDACVDVDYQWDSTRDPQNWGSGGEYGEEWSSMHRRFKTGLERMVNWYRSGEAVVNKMSDGRRNGANDNDDDDNDDDGTETVLVLVTHGAGCNALIGALTNRPALVNVGTSSLTMAVRKDTAASPRPDDSPPEIPDEYELKHVASSDHLRVGSSSSFQSQPSPRGFANNNNNNINSNNPMSSFRRYGSVSGSTVTSPTDHFSLGGDSVTRSWSTRRSSHAPSRSMFTARASTGLWGSTPAADSADDLIPNFGDPFSAPRPSTAVDRRSTASSEQAGDPPSRRPNHGLWNGSSGGRERDPATKRRWTVVERAP
ncbi:hypothetical protein VTO42DRAFT_4254 [Malbranchea cinnamomea]